MISREITQDIIDFDATQHEVTRAVFIGSMAWVFFAIILIEIFDYLLPYSPNIAKLMEIFFTLSPLLILGWTGISMFLFWFIPLSLCIWLQS